MTPDRQDDVIAFLSDPDRLGHGPVEIVETHGSMVFMTPERAFKLKKAVRFSYLDYSTLALREAACKKELEINARFAPQLYLSASPITRQADGGLALNGGGAPVDWVVVMRRFRSADQFDRLAARGALTPELTRSLADQIAAAHDQASPDASFGGADAMARICANSLRDLRDYARDGLPAAEVEAWATAAEAALASIGPLLDQRRADGRVRLGHGDLHLANICLCDGAPTLFDAIEFDPALSTIDVLYDLAFLLMDLEARGLRRETNLVFNRYLDLRDEGDGVAALPFFMSLRAAIRAQVTYAASRNAHDLSSVAETRDRSLAYLKLAIELLQAHPPRLVAVGGFSGTGKSTLAQALAPWIGAAPGARVLRSDVLRKRCFGVGPETRLPPEGYAPDAHRRTYRQLLMEAGRCLRGGRSVIADAVFGRVEERDGIAAVATEVGAPFAALWLTAPQPALEQRVADRVNDASDATVAVVRAQIARGEHAAEWIRIDAGEDPAATAATACEQLGIEPG